jgi:O-antigen/teichoic acid export membrane protein
MNLYRKVYRIIGCVILSVGLILLPFIRSLIKGDLPTGIDIHIVYIIFLLNSVLSYWLFAYKNCLLTAYQKNNIYTKIQIVTSALMYISQIALLYCFKNYYIYAIIMPITTILNNVIVSYCVDKQFPQIKAAGRVTDAQFAQLKKNVVGMLFAKVSFTLRRIIGNIVVSAILGLYILGIYNNYFYITSALSAVVVIVIQSISAGIGNSLAMETVSKNARDFRLLRYVYMVLSFIIYCGLLAVLQPFMQMWAGKDLVFSDITMILFAILFLIEKTMDVPALYYDSLGLWWAGRWYCVLSAVGNTLLVIAGCYFYGVIGALIGGIVAVLLCAMPFQYYYVNKYYFQRRTIYDCATVLLQLVVFILLGAIDYIIVNRIEIADNAILTILVRGICGIVFGGMLLYITMCRTKIFRDSLQWVGMRVPVVGTLVKALHL